MPKPYTLPTLYNDVLQLSTTDLKRWGYLVPNQLKSGTITWRTNGHKTGRISITANTRADLPFVLLDYQYGGDPRSYKVRLVSTPSNIGNGSVWYFLCPETHKRCRKLYSVGGHFLHREAFSGCMYESQTWSKKFRDIERQYRSYFDFEKTLSELDTKHMKKAYAGKPTKRYLRLKRKYEDAQQFSHRDIERLLLI